MVPATAMAVAGMFQQLLAETVPESGGEPQPLVIEGLPENTRVPDVLPLPGGRLAVVQVNNTTGDGLYLLDRTSGQAALLVDEGSSPAWSPTGHLLWTREDVLYAARFDADAGALASRPVPVLQGVRSRLGLSDYSLSDDGTLAWIPGEAGSLRSLRV